MWDQKRNYTPGEKSSNLWNPRRNYTPGEVVNTILKIVGPTETTSPSPYWPSLPYLRLLIKSEPANNKTNAHESWYPPNPVLTSGQRGVHLHTSSTLKPQFYLSLLPNPKFTFTCLYVAHVKRSQMRLTLLTLP